MDKEVLVDNIYQTISWSTKNVGAQPSDEMPEIESADRKFAEKLQKQLNIAYILDQDKEFILKDKNYAAEIVDSIIDIEGTQINPQSKDLLVKQLQSSLILNKSNSESVVEDIAQNLKKFLVKNNGDMHEKRARRNAMNFSKSDISR